MTSKQMAVLLILAPVVLALGMSDVSNSPHFFHEFFYLVVVTLAYYAGVLDSVDEQLLKESPEGITIKLLSPGESLSDLAGLETK